MLSGKSLVSVFQGFSASIDKALVLAAGGAGGRGGGLGAGRWALGYHSIKFRHF